jgi:hypothetical protein
MRPNSLLRLLQSVVDQSIPDEIMVDGSLTQIHLLLKQNSFKKSTLSFSNTEHRGLTKQRNYGVRKVSDGNEIICFR